jgi:hypothetical protein
MPPYRGRHRRHAELASRRNRRAVIWEVIKKSATTLSVVVSLAKLVEVLQPLL